MFRLIALVCMAGLVVALLGHRVIFGAVKVKRAPRTVRRFSLWERFIHIVTVLGFLSLGVSGFFVALQGERLHHALWVFHVAMAFVFVSGLTALVITWAKDGRFAMHDWKWVFCAGGYLGFGKHPPAGRFNAGQKGYLWAVGLLGVVCLVSGLGRAYPVFSPLGQEILYQVHRWGALAFVLAAIVHLYLGTIGNPGTFNAMVTGKVTPEWAEQHHPVWWGEIKDNGK